MTSLPSKSKAVAVCQCRNKPSQQGLCAPTNDTRKTENGPFLSLVGEYSGRGQNVFCCPTESVLSGDREGHLVYVKVVPLYQGEGRHCTTKGKPPPFRDCEGWGYYLIIVYYLPDQEGTSEDFRHGGKVEAICQVACPDGAFRWHLYGFEEDCTFCCADKEPFFRCLHLTCGERGIVGQ